MQWLRAHPYASLCALSGVVLLILVALVSGRTVPVSAGPTAWVATGNPQVEIGSPAPQPSIVQENTTTASIFSSEPVAVVTPFTATAAVTPTSLVSPSLSEQYAPAATSSSQETSAQALFNFAYSFVPGTTAAPAATSTSRTPDQEALYTYGNAAGQIVSTFENDNAGMAQVLQNWLNDRGNAVEGGAVQTIAQDMQTAGVALFALPNVPQEAVSDNQALAASYEDAAEKLNAVVAAGGSDTTLVSAMETYDSSADASTKDYLALADLFVTWGVSFSATDPGSVFSFSAAEGQ